MQFEENKALLLFPLPLWERVARIVRWETGEGSRLLVMLLPSSGAEPVIGRAFARPVGATFSHKGRRKKKKAPVETGA